MTVQQFTDAVEIEGSQDITQLKVQGHSTQTAPLQVWQDSAADEQAQLTGDGRLQVGSFDSGMMATDDALIEAHRDANDTAKPRRGLHLLGEVSGVLDSIVSWGVQELVLKGSGGISALHSALRVRLTNENTGTMGSGADLRAADVEIVNHGGGDGNNVPELTGLRVAVTNQAAGYADTAYGLKVEINDDGDLGQAYAIHTGQGVVHLGDIFEVPTVAATPPADPPAGFVQLYTKLSDIRPRLYLKDPSGAEYAVDSGPAASYLLYDAFDTDEAAPLTSPRSAEPGPGGLVVVDSTDKLAISNGVLAIAGGIDESGDPAVFSEDAFARTPGLAFLVTARRASGSLDLGFDDNQTGYLSVHAMALSWSNGEIVINNSDASNYLGLQTGDFIAANTDHELAIVLREEGAYHLVKGGAFPTWTLCWVAGQRTVSNLYASVQSYSAAGQVDHFRVVQLAEQFAADQVATLSQAAPPSATSYVATADGIHDFAFELPASPSAGQKIELRYRVQDVNTYWTAYVERNGGNTAWDFNLDSVSGGSATNRINVTGVGDPERLRVVVRGTKHDCYTQEGTIWTKRGSQVDVLHVTVEPALQAVYPGGTTSQALQSWPRTSANYAELNEV